MASPIPVWKALRARELLAKGVAQRTIAVRLGISRGTVQAIDYGTYNLARAKQREQCRAAEISCSFDESSEPERCPSCGGKCFQPKSGWPCTMCRARKRKRDEIRATIFAASVLKPTA